MKEENWKIDVEFTEREKVIQRRRVRVQSRTEPSLLRCGFFLQVPSPPRRWICSVLPTQAEAPSLHRSGVGKECQGPHSQWSRHWCQLHIPHPQWPRLLLSGQGHPGAKTCLPSTALLYPTPSFHCGCQSFNPTDNLLQTLCKPLCTTRGKHILHTIAF